VRTARTVKRIDTMQALAFDLLPDHDAVSTAGIDQPRRDDDDASCAEAAKLEQLQDRVMAARSVY
jgi:hypothetical protein